MLHRFATHALRKEGYPRALRRVTRLLWFVPLLLISATCRADKDQQADVLMLALPASAYVLTLVEDDDEGAWQLTKSLGAAALATLALNALIEDDAPNGSSDDAFPSGHATIAFGTAAFIQRRYGWKRGLPAYLVASYTGWLRVETDDHDYTDVLGGAAVGILASYLLTDRFADNVRASAWSDGQALGLRVDIRW